MVAWPAAATGDRARVPLAALGRADRERVAVMRDISRGSPSARLSNCAINDAGGEESRVKYGS